MIILSWTQLKAGAAKLCTMMWQGRLAGTVLEQRAVPPKGGSMYEYESPCFCKGCHAEVGKIMSLSLLFVALGLLGALSLVYCQNHIKGNLETAPRDLFLGKLE